MRIDAHQHFWRLAHGCYPWLEHAPAVLRRDYMPADLMPSLRRFGFERSVLVQAAQSEEETGFLLDLAAEHAFVAGVVGWLDLEAVDFPDRLAALRARGKFCGVRPMVQDLPDGWLRRPAVIASLRHLAASGVPIDLLTYPRHLPDVLHVLRRVPGLRAVIDHLSKPAIASGGLDPWRDRMAEIAGFETVTCKVSGMVTEAGPDWDVPDLTPFVDHVAGCFGAERLMFGSDWPVCRVACDYGAVVAAASLTLARHFSPDEMGWVFGGAAQAFYRLDAAPG